MLENEELIAYLRKRGSLQQQLAASQQREKAAIELIDNIHHRVKPAQFRGYQYFPREGVAEDVFQMIEKWRGVQEEE